MKTDPNIELENTGRFWFRQAIPEAELCKIEEVPLKSYRPGTRLKLNEPLAHALRADGVLATFIERLLPNSHPVRLVSFNKQITTNWSLPWHQDRVIAVAQKRSVEGFSNWSQKAGVWHVKPPIDLLERMMFARIHLDDCNISNGCLQLAIGSHKHGLVRSEDAATLASLGRIEDCIAKRGDVLVAKALTLHRSLSSNIESSRRALRVDYANFDLPMPLSWAIGKPHFQQPIS